MSTSQKVNKSFLEKKEMGIQNEHKTKKNTNFKWDGIYKY